MPVVECPIPGCSYKTANLNDSVVIALIKAHSVSHSSKGSSKADTFKRRNFQSDAATVSEDKGIKMKFPLKMLTLQDLRQDKNVMMNVVGLLLCAVAFLLDTICSFTQPFWYRRVEEKDGHTLTTNVGLWKACIETKDRRSRNGSYCFDHYNHRFSRDYLVVGGAQVFQCLGFISIIVAIFSILLKIFKWRKTNFLTTFGASYALWTGVCFLGSIGFVSNGLRRTSHDTYIDFGYVTACISGIVALIGSIILFGISCWINSKKSDKQESTPNLEPTANESVDPTYQELMP